MADEVLQRRGARVLVLDENGRVLLIQGGDPADPDASRYWFTVGGGIEPDERSETAAIRELAEETGLRVPESEMFGPIFSEDVRFRFNGRTYDQHNVFYVVRTPGFTPDRSGWDEIEQRSMTEFRWWSAAEISASAETIYPKELAGLLTELAASVDGRTA